MLTKIVRLLYRPKPSYELFMDADERTPWFLIICFPRFEDWDAYAVLRVTRQMIRELSVISNRLGDRRAAMLYDRLTTLTDIALQTEPLEGERGDGKLHDA